MLVIEKQVLAILYLPLLKGGFNVKGKEAQTVEKRTFHLDESNDNLRATHYWYGPNSPVFKKNESSECRYRHIFFPTKL
jgi:hypothetical protein